MKSISPDTRRPVLLKDERIDSILASLPGGEEGFLKYWGLLQFAAAIERELGVDDKVASALKSKDEEIYRLKAHLTGLVASIQILNKSSSMRAAIDAARAVKKETSMTDTTSAASTYDQIVAVWNAQADDYNQWDELGEDEKIEWAVECVHAAVAQRDAEDATYRERWDAELGRTAMKFVDRAGDVHPGVDDAEAVCAEFHAAMSAVIERMPHVQRMNAANEDARAAARAAKASLNT